MRSKSWRSKNSKQPRYFSHSNPQKVRLTQEYKERVKLADNFKKQEEENARVRGLVLADLQKADKVRLKQNIADREKRRLAARAEVVKQQQEMARLELAKNKNYRDVGSHNLPYKSSSTPRRFS